MELVRELSLSFADDGKRVKVIILATNAYIIAQPPPPFSFPSNKFTWLVTWYQVCVQGSMGQGAFAGIPLQLAGTRKILEFMDWGDYGAKGTFINIGAVGLLPTYSMLQIVSIIKWNEVS